MADSIFNPPAVRSEKRKRSRGGCVFCKRWKKKCDELTPCTRCAEAGKECVYPPRRTGNSKRKRAADSTAGGADAPDGGPELPQRAASTSSRTPLPVDRSVSPGMVGTSMGEVISVLPERVNAEAGPSRRPDATARLEPIGGRQQRPTPSPAAECSQQPVPPPAPDLLFNSETDLLEWFNDLGNQRQETPTSSSSLSERTARAEATPAAAGSASIPGDPLTLAGSQQALLESLIFDRGPASGGSSVDASGSPADPPIEMLGIPYDCEPAVWRAFVESSLWHGQPQEASSARMQDNLMAYFRDFASTTIVISHGEYGVSHLLYRPLAQLALDSPSDALTQAILHLSAVHVSNFAFTCGKPDRAIFFWTEAEKRRSLALRALRVSAADDSDELRTARPAIMLLLTLSSFLRGDCDIVPSYLKQCSTFLDRLETAFPTADDMSPLCCGMRALHTLYTVFLALAQDRQKDPKALFAAWHRWGSSARCRMYWNGVTESVAGISMDMLVLLIKVHNLKYEHAVLATALARLPGDIELSLMEVETRSNAQAIFGRLADERLWAAHYRIDYSERTQLGHEIYRLAARVSILSDIFTDASTARIAGVVEQMTHLCSQIPAGTEIGCLWPWIVIASQAANDQREATLPFIRRCQWKGSANPRLAEKVVQEVWRRRDGGEAHITWRKVIDEMGSPVLL